MFKYECPECGYEEERDLAITRYTCDEDKTCPDCERCFLERKFRSDTRRTNKKYLTRKKKRGS